METINSLGKCLLRSQDKQAFCMSTFIYVLCIVLAARVTREGLWMQAGAFDLCITKSIPGSES